LLIFKLRDQHLHVITAWPQISINVFVRKIANFLFTVCLSKLHQILIIQHSHLLSKLTGIPIIKFQNYF